MSVALISLAVLVAMLAVTTAIGMLFRTLFDVHRIPDYVWVCVDYADAVVFGAILAWLVRTDGLRVAFFASLFLVVCFVAPALAGNPGSQAPPAGWILLFGAIPTMCFGAGLYQAVSRRTDGAN
jgi:branched-subunit amino acid transport protein